MSSQRKWLAATGMLTGILMLVAASTPALRAQTPAASENLADVLIGSENSLGNPSSIDVAALRQQVADRIKSRADAIALKRPPIAPELSKLPQFAFDIVFDPDSSLVRPDSYKTIGRIADALYDPKLLPYTFLIVGHTESSGRRDANLALSQKRADSIRDVLVMTFKVSSKRLQSIGLGEEQLQDPAHPTSPTNLGLQIITVGQLP